MPRNAFVMAPRLREKKKQGHKQSKSHQQSKNEVEAGRNSLFLPPALGGRLGSVPIPQAGCREFDVPPGGAGGVPLFPKTLEGGLGGITAPAARSPTSPPCLGARGRAEILPSRRGPHSPRDDSEQRLARLHAPLVRITGFARGTSRRDDGAAISRRNPGRRRMRSPGRGPGSHRHPVRSGTPPGRCRRR